ncbi:methyl-accepting chemotaxis protein [Fervidibacillus albus]|uniref:Methyl-accepting chemotaxis protein n=1 Tax=Fervidibacillus albus TaxID=2980026 RepID=A0A9E8LUB3_9BACI|nr:methyl-accepting chemotaxis protein [Fervidibacillus albus]WAA09311.1 methyl-accepting chemotaxis protein [Fervidibacillus albus]
MQLKNILKLNMMMIVLLLLTAGSSLYFLFTANQARTDTIEQQIDLKEMANEILVSSNYLSEQIRFYTQFGEKKYLDAYMKEKNENNVQNEMKYRLEELNAPQNLFSIIQEIQVTKQNLDRLEEEAIVAIEGNDVNSAQEIVLGEGYTIAEMLLQDHIKSFQNELNEWVSIQSEKAQSQVIFSLYFTIIALLFVSIFSIIFHFVLRRKVRPLNELTKVAHYVSKGHLNVKMVRPESKDEISVLSETMQTMVDNLNVIIQQITTTSHLVASSSKELLASSEQSAQAAKQVSRSIEQVSANAEAQTNQIESNLHMFTIIQETIKHMAEKMNQINQLAQNTKRNAKEGNAFVNETADQMTSIYRSVIRTNRKINDLLTRSKEIDKITIAISNIAEQTNLLALNAAIEAARAGAHGQGFAVVAEEVRKLAEQSQESAKLIGTIISVIQTDTVESVELMAKVSENVNLGLNITNGTKDKFTRIMGEIGRLAPLIEEISKSANEVVEQINRGMKVESNLVNVAQENAATALEVSASSEEQLATIEEISTSTEVLSNTAEKMQAIVSKFKI